MPSPAKHSELPAHASALQIRRPTVRDAAAIWRMVRDCDVLDTNSCYAYLLICRDFATTSLVATREGRLVGFVVAYVPPNRCDTIFVWQIGVSAAARNQGVAKLMLHSLVDLVASRGIRYLEATVTPSNAASRHLFQSFAKELRGAFRIIAEFSRDDFGVPAHEPEETVRIHLNRSEHGHV